MGRRADWISPGEGGLPCICRHRAWPPTLKVGAAALTGEDLIPLPRVWPWPTRPQLPCASASPHLRLSNVTGGPWRVRYSQRAGRHPPFLIQKIWGGTQDAAFSNKFPGLSPLQFRGLSLLQDRACRAQESCHAASGPAGFSSPPLLV